ncbi:Major heat shock 70 kDa protein Bb [Actinomortierella wolfii]|nr:Major heat shock 70 kDa protein Bb [Actinomortierella wolfii]
MHKETTSKTFDGTIGIDLGNTTSCVAVWEKGGVHVIADDEGEPTTTPVCVGFTDEKCIIGDLAKTEAIKGDTNTIYDLLHIIGRQYDDPEIQNQLKRWSFRLTNKDMQPYIEIKLGDQTKLFSPQEISAKVIEQMKETAENYLKAKVVKAVITVPASFNSAQRKATVEAANLAGLHTVHLIEKPVAAIYPYTHRYGDNVTKKYLVIHLGGRSCEAAVISLSGDRNTLPQVQFVASDTRLGGDNFTQVLLESCKEEVRQQFNEDIKKDPFTLSQFHQSCERAKIHLSSSSSMSSSTAFGVFSLVHGFTYSTEISRAQFEDLSTNLFNLIIQVVEQALKGANLHKTDIGEVFLTGGSTSIPKVRSVLQDFFVGKPLRTLDEALDLSPHEVRTLGEKALSPDEFPAYGAAYYGHMLCMKPSAAKED